MARPYKILRDLLRQNEITSEILAEELGIQVSTVSRKLNDHTPWNSDQMYAILELIGEKPARMHEIFPKNGINEPGVKRRPARTSA